MAKKEVDKTSKKKNTSKKTTNAGASPKAEMRVSKKPVSKKEVPVDKASRFSTFFNVFKENVSEGAKAFANISSDILEEVKEKAEELYGKGAEKFEQASGVVENYVESYKSEQEIKELSKEKEDLNAIFGNAIYHEFMKNGTVSKRFLTTKKSTELISSIESIDKRILKLGKELDKK